MTQQLKTSIELMTREITRSPHDWTATGYSEAGCCGGFQGDDDMKYQHMNYHQWDGDKFKVEIRYMSLKQSKILFKKELVFYYDNNMRIPIGVTSNNENNLITFTLNSRKKKTITFKL